METVMTVKPTLNKYFDIAASSLGLLAVFVSPTARKEPTVERKIVHLHVENYAMTFANALSSEHANTGG